MRLELRRIVVSQWGTFGVLLFPNYAPELVTLEDVWLGNANRISCIPTGTYTCRQRQSPKHGKTYRVDDVPGRSQILFHVGNFAGDPGQTNGDTQGCILLGRRWGFYGGVWSILESKDAFNRFMSLLAGEASFELVVKAL